MCNDDYVVILDKHKANVNENDKIILQGSRNKNDNLWDIEIPIIALPTPTNQVVNAIIRRDTSKKNLLITYISAFIIRPYPRLNKKFSEIMLLPGRESMICTSKKYCSKTMATTNGHLDQEQENLQSAKMEPATINDDSFPALDSPNINKYTTFTMICKQTAFFDLTRRFPHQSADGNNYLMITYDYDSNSILVQAIPNWEASSISKAWKRNHDRLTKVAAAPSHNILDNEFSSELQKSLEAHNVTTEKVPPNLHRRNTAERAIHTLKNHLLAGLAGVDPSYPIRQWDKLLQLAEITLNLLHTSHVNQKLSAYAYIFGNFDFNKTHSAPVGTKLTVHVKPDKRKSWAYHTELGYYVGPAMELYRCFKCFIPATGGIRVADTVNFSPYNGDFPSVTVRDQFLQALTDILSLIKQPNHNLPFLHFGDNAKMQ